MSNLMGLLNVQGERRSRSKSPGGRERERSRSNIRDVKPDDVDRRRSETKSSKKDYDSGSEDDRRRRRNSRRQDMPEEEVERYRSSRSKKEERPSGRRQDSDSDDGRYKAGKKSSRRRGDSDSDSDNHDRRAGYGKQPPSIVTVTPTSAASTAKIPFQSAAKTPVQVQPTHTQVNAYSYAPPPGYVPQPPGAFPDRPHGALSETRHMSYGGPDPRYTTVQPNYAPHPDEFRQRAASSAGQQYAQLPQFQYAKLNQGVNYGGSYRDTTAGNTQDQKVANYGVSYRDTATGNAQDQQMKPQIISVDPRNIVDPRRSDSRVLDSKYTDEKYSQGGREKDKRYSEDTYKSRERGTDRKEKRLDDRDDDKNGTRRLSRLSIGGAAGAATLGVAAAAAAHGPTSNGKPPPSPLLEAYKGTYQSISPMPSALVLAGHKFDSDVSDVELDSDDSLSDKDPEAERKRAIKRLEKEKQWIEKKQGKADGGLLEYERQRPGRNHYETRIPDDDGFSLVSTVISPKTSRKKVTWYEAEDDAKEIAAALKGSKPPNIKPLGRILPYLSLDDLDALKAEYKNHATINGQGINMSKHIKARVPGHFGKAAYACSLGQYEGDAYWANCFYQSGASRRELLIESLLGRTNQQIREIKNFFKDKKYDDDLEKCLKAELKADKFRSAILLALEERRQAESNVLDPRLLRHDVEDLYDALHSSGGESAMIHIIVLRSDAHLREMLRQYERDHGRNFAQEMISKSRNLVGESLAHILNGALNRSMRDALLLHQAIAETAPGKERAELLISRLVRLHWEPKHLEKVKSQYAQRYGIRVDDAIRREIQANMKTEEGIAWTSFCIALIKSSE